MSYCFVSEDNQGSRPRGCNLLEEIEPLSAHRIFEASRDIAAWAVRHQITASRVGYLRQISSSWKESNGRFKESHLHIYDGTAPEFALG